MPWRFRALGVLGAMRRPFAASIGPLFAIVPLLIAGCGGAPAASNAAASDYASSSPSGSSASAKVQAAASGTGSIKLGDLTFNDLGTMDASGRPDVALGVRGFAFTPTFIRGTPNQKLTLKIENATGTPHNFSVADQHIDQSLAPNGKAEVVVVFPASGVLRFFCSLHAGSGMNGELLTGDAKPPGVTGPTSPAPKDSYEYSY